MGSSSQDYHLSEGAYEVDHVISAEAGKRPTENDQNVKRAFRPAHHSYDPAPYSYGTSPFERESSVQGVDDVINTKQVQGQPPTASQRTASVNGVTPTHARSESPATTAQTTQDEDLRPSSKGRSGM